MPASVASPHRRALPAVLVVAFVALATTYNVLTPPWEAPDEFAHFGFAEHVVRHRALPVPDAADAGEAHQPPLYYAILAAAIAWVDLDDPSGRFRFNRQARIAGTGGDDVNVALHGNDESFPFRGVALAIHVGRAVSTVFGAATVLLAIALAAVVVGARGPAAVQRFDGSWYQGRYLFPVLAPVATVLSLGALGPLAERLRARVVLAVVAFLLVVAVALPYSVLVPAYSRTDSARSVSATAVAEVPAVDVERPVTSVAFKMIASR